MAACAAARRARDASISSGRLPAFRRARACRIASRRLAVSSRRALASSRAFVVPEPRSSKPCILWRSCLRVAQVHLDTGQLRLKLGDVLLAGTGKAQAQLRVRQVALGGRLTQGEPCVGGRRCGKLLRGGHGVSLFHAEAFEVPRDLGGEAHVVASTWPEADDQRVVVALATATRQARDTPGPKACRGRFMSSSATGIGESPSRLRPGVSRGYSGVRRFRAAGSRAASVPRAADFSSLPPGAPGRSPRP
jgi:hypothetical protein